MTASYAHGNAELPRTNLLEAWTHHGRHQHFWCRVVVWRQKPRA